MKKYIICLMLFSFLMSEDIFDKNKWYFGISRSESNALVFGNATKGWRYSLSYTYTENKDLKSIDNDYNYDQNTGDFSYLNTDNGPLNNSVDMSYVLNLRKYILKSNLGKKTDRFTSNLAVGFSIAFHKGWYNTYYENTYSGTEVRNHSEYKTYAFRPYLGYNIEVFLKNNFSINLFANISTGYSVTSNLTQSADYINSILVNLDTNEKEFEGIDIGVTGFEWTINYYFNK